MTERPPSIVWFQWLYLGTLAAGIVDTVLTWEELTVLGSTAFVLTVLGLVMAFMLLLYFLIAHRRSNGAKWVLTIFYALGFLFSLPVTAAALRAGVAMRLIFDLAMTLAQGVAIGLLFTPSARAWFAAKREGQAEPLRRTFE